MRNLALAVGVVALVATTPTLTQARSACHEQAARRTTTGTLVGAGAGALIGNAVAPKGGALWGGLGGAVVGNQLARTKCYHNGRYYRGYYYHNGRRVYYR